LPIHAKLTLVVKEREGVHSRGHISKRLLYLV